ncbi:sigma-54-dependent Fis family transcriptional regulator [Zobellella endophytica]|uniref:Sigma-54-dependent Fis family transcriptional regulator n=1 Tax=Zobellella endophytica TaxID=2116700 RepID=A0A2P7R893_9GAMM|nr:sigma-54-dependent Fis family transcriptional regulator [Zobellella endophytica]PSJ46421.1 sigma-54-dependent Fis family transcriptional regulator [Zobellella endophytica]
MRDLESLKIPEAGDLIAGIRFDGEQGKIWFNEQRMLLIHATVMGLLRKELIETLGVQRAKRFLMRFGYHSGMKDAEIARKVRPHIAREECFMAGPQMHGIRGMVKVVPTRLELDMDSGHFLGEFDWFNSYEADVHQNEFGHADEPICWTLLGYASGYTSYFMGRTIIYKEVRCVAMGDAHCSIVGKPAQEWEDQAEIEKFMLPDPVAEELFALRSELVKLRDSVGDESEDDYRVFNSIGQSAAFRQVCKLIQRASHSRVTVLLLGETGVGKEVFARGLHVASDRADQPFVAVNCACIPPDLIEAELFGVEKGAYTGATQSREGKFERADGGTIFLDEVVELSSRAQASLLRVLQEGELERVGDVRTRRIDVRVVTATNEDLQQAVREGRFRADLFYRLNIFPVHIPPLRERKEDIPLLVQHFLNRYQAMYNKRILGVTDKAREALLAYEWPGNIRELENLIERGIILTDNNNEIEVCSFFPAFKDNGSAVGRVRLDGSLRETAAEADDEPDDWCTRLLTEDFSLENLEQSLIRHALNTAEGNVSRAARILGLTRPALAYRMKKLE